MKKWRRNVGFGLVGLGSALSILFSVQHTKANEADNFATEAAVAVQAYAAMDSRSQNQLLSSMSMDQMDLESAMMAVQSNRATLLEQQLKDQLQEVQKRNEELAALNEELAALNQKLAEFPQGDTSDEKKDLEVKINNLKGQIDSFTNTQQMDMLRLQSLSNKRNEAFDLMTDFVKKMQDNRSSIIGNMR